MEMHGQWFRDREGIPSVDTSQSDKWLKNAQLTPETESLIIAAQEQTLATNYVRKNIWKTDCDPRCRICKESAETVKHIVSGCTCLAGSKYTNRHDKLGTYVHWTILKDLGINVCDEWFKHVPEKVVESGETIIMWDYAIITDKKVGANRPDITIHDRKEKKVILIDFSVPYDMNIVEKTAEKITKYRDLEIEIKKCWKLNNVITVPVIVGALGTVCADFLKYLKLISKNLNPNIIQKTALLGTANILRSVLSMESIETSTK